MNKEKRKMQKIIKRRVIRAGHIKHDKEMIVAFKNRGKRKIKRVTKK